MADLPEIVTSGSAYKSFQACPRKRWWEYEAPNGTGRGWQRQRLSLPLATGGWCHKVVEGLARSAGLVAASASELVVTEEAGCLVRAGDSAGAIIRQCVAGYKEEARTKGLDLGLELSGFVPEEKFVERTIAEQAALLEAFGWAYNRVRLPRICDEYEIVSVEREEFALLSGDVGLQARIDMVLRRKADQRLFIYNLKTSSAITDKRWKDQWEVDQQLMTETLAVERRLGEQVYGVIIDGFDKGQRVTVDWHTLKEKPKDDAEKWQAQRSRLIYGYKCEDIPGRPTMYDFEGTTRKGWGKFAVWEEAFSTQTSAVEHWVHWLPPEVCEAQFVTLPPIMRSEEHVQAKVRQMVAVEQDIRDNRGRVEEADNPKRMLDVTFPQNEHACTYPSKCPMYRLCWEPGAADDPQAAGYVPREANHPTMEAE